MFPQSSSPLQNMSAVLQLAQQASQIGAPAPEARVIDSVARQLDLNTAKDAAKTLADIRGLNPDNDPALSVHLETISRKIVELI